MSKIYDTNGALKFEIKPISDSEKRVYDRYGKLVGVIKNGRTFDSNGRQISMNEDISALTVRE